jgi:hypothetical protein
MLPKHHYKKTAAFALARGAPLPATASAKPIGADPSPFKVPETPVVQITAPASGFDWGDSGIGACGGLALAMLGLGGGLVVSQRRGRAGQGTS